MALKLARLTLLAVVAGTLLSLRRQASHRRLGLPKAKPPAVQTWESEGGALPQTGSQLGPEPKKLTDLATF